MVIDYGNGAIATSIENVIRFGKTSMKLVISNILLVVLIFVVLNILYEIFLLAVDNEISKVISKIMSELVFAVFLFFIMTNWLGGVNILENILEPLIFERIPKYIFSFKVDNQSFFVTDGVLLNLDSVWNTLEEIPKRIYEIKSAWLIFIDWVFKSNLGFNIILLLLKMFMYIMIILFFGDILRIIIEIHLMLIFSGIAFILMVFKPLRENYGMIIPNTIIKTAIQYYMVFICIGLITGFLNYIYSIGGKFLYIAAIFLSVSFMKSIISSIRRVGAKL